MGFKTLFSVGKNSVGALYNSCSFSVNHFTEALKLEFFTNVLEDIEAILQKPIIKEPIVILGEQLPVALYAVIKRDVGILFPVILELPLEFCAD